MKKLEEKFNQIKDHETGLSEIVEKCILNDDFKIHKGDEYVVTIVIDNIFIDIWNYNDVEYTKIYRIKDLNVFNDIPFANPLLVREIVRDKFKNKQKTKKEYLEKELNFIKTKLVELDKNEKK